MACRSPVAVTRCTASWLATTDLKSIPLGPIKVVVLPFGHVDVLSGDVQPSSTDSLMCGGPYWANRPAMDGWVRVVDRATGELFPPIWDVEPQLRREVERRREAQERARLAEERAIQAEEREQQSVERERLTRLELAMEVARHVAEHARLEREHAEAVAQLRRRLEELEQRA
jgi:uncharacterized Zn finger protein (UPF0148 family)